jgi:hypothetical protein
MSNPNNIDRLFREKFKDFEAEVPKDSWSYISKNIPTSSNSLATFSRTKYYIATTIVMVSTAIALYLHSIYDKPILLDSTTGILEKSLKKGPYEIVSIQEVEANYKNFNDLLKKQIEEKHLAKKAIRKSNPIKNIVVSNTVLNEKTETVIIEEAVKAETIKANIFKIGENNEVFKIKTTILSESEILKYIKGVADSTSIISELPNSSKK